MNSYFRVIILHGIGWEKGIPTTAGSAIIIFSHEIRLETSVASASRILCLFWYECYIKSHDVCTFPMCVNIYFNVISVNKWFGSAEYVKFVNKTLMIECIAKKHWSEWNKCMQICRITPAIYLPSVCMQTLLKMHMADENGRTNVCKTNGRGFLHAQLGIIERRPTSNIFKRIL